MRSARELIFEHDIPLGADMMAKIRDRPYAQRKFELELAIRQRGSHQ
jgi:hypothetical protein